MSNLKTYVKLTTYTIIIFILFFKSELIAEENEFFGFLKTRNSHPLALYHYAFSKDNAYTLNKGEKKLNISLTISNTFNRRYFYYMIDAETRLLNINFKYGISDNSELSIDLPVFKTSGGISDSFINNWHNTFKLPKGGRDRVNDNSFRIVGDLENDERLNLKEEKTAIGNITLEEKYKLYYDTEKKIQISLKPVISLPTSTSNIRQKGIDLGISTLISKDFSKNFNLSSTFGYLYYTDNTLSNLIYHKNHFFGFIGGEYKIKPNWSILCSISGESALVKNLINFPDHSLYLDYSNKFKLNKNFLLAIGLRENITPSRGTTDFEVTLEVCRGF